MAKAFKKGDAVTYLASWDNKGTVAYRHAVVHSCGSKQMILTDAVSGQEIGRHFAPVKGDADKVGYAQWSGTFARMTDEEAEALCFAVVSKMPAALAVENERRKAFPALRPIEVEFHEPRALNRTGL